MNEAEYVALSEVACVMKFIVQILKLMEIVVKMQITVHVDSMEAIFLANNQTQVIELNTWMYTII